MSSGTPIINITPLSADGYKHWSNLGWQVSERKKQPMLIPSHWSMPTVLQTSVVLVIQLSKKSALEDATATRGNKQLDFHQWPIAAYFVLQVKVIA